MVVFFLTTSAFQFLNCNIGFILEKDSVVAKKVKKYLSVFFFTIKRAGFLRESQKLFRNSVI
jgi:hypothetical protein